MSRFSKAVKKVTRNPVNTIGRAALGVGSGGISELLQKHPLGLNGNPILPGGIEGLLGGGGSSIPDQFAGNDMAAINQLAQEEEAKRQALGKQQQGQINSFADSVSADAAKRRATLATSLSDIGQQTFNRMNPGILEDLNRRGLFTSQTARDQEQGRVLGDLSRDQAGQLNTFDTNVANQLNDIRGTGLSALIGGDQSALDSALSLRKAGIQRTFDVADQNVANQTAAMLAKQQNKNNLLSSLIGAGGNILGGWLAG